MSGPFKMKNQGLASSAKYKNPIQYASPANSGVLDTIKSGYNTAKTFATNFGNGLSNIDLTPGYAGNPQFPDISGDFKRGFNKSEKNKTTKSKNESSDQTK